MNYSYIRGQNGARDYRKTLCKEKKNITIELHMI